MKVLLIGSGGREHALAWKLAQSGHVSRLWCAPGNAGIATERLSNGALVECVPAGLDDLPNLLGFAEENRPELTVVGPEQPLSAGIVDLFQKNGFRIWGPNQRAAQFEASKVFSQEFMEKHGVPTAKSGVFSDAAAARNFAASLGGRCAVKADGLAAGKGVFICTSVKESDQAVDDVLVRKTFGVSGGTIVIQELLDGMEISMHALCDGRTAKLFPAAQDHKRAFDGDQGLNTGGMGAYSPAPFLNPAELERAGRAVLDPWVRGCAAEGIEFRGILFPGVMLTKEGPKVLEFNARFGDPETQAYLTRLENDLVELFEACLDGELNRTELRWSANTSVCVVMASGGYPGPFNKGLAIRGLEAAAAPDTKVFHAGTALKEGRVVTSGGRVLGVTAWGRDLPAARASAYAAVEKIQFDGAHFRRDIGAKALQS